MIGALDGDDARLIERLPPDALEAHGIPTQEDAAARRRGLEQVTQTLAELEIDGLVRVSPLGPEWSRDIDVYVRELPDPEELAARGWVPLDDLLRTIGSNGEGRWAVVSAGEVVAGVDFNRGRPHDPLTSILRRCEERGEVRLREVLELRELVRRGTTIPPSEVAHVAAAVEASLGGDLLGGGGDAPGALPGRIGRGALRRRLIALRRLLRRRLVVAVAGVDGAGKSTLTRSLHVALRRAGVPTDVVWTRPGLRIGMLDPFARAVKTVLREQQAPAVREMAQHGESAGLRSRQGSLGWLWLALVNGAFAIDLWRRHLRGRGVLLYDRHLADAIATIRFAYAGVDLRLHETFLRAVVPHAALTIYLSVPAAVAAARKPDDVIGMYAIERQLASYVDLLDELEARGLPVLTLDATRPREAIALDAFRALAEGRRRRT